jgi:hypothetical protein
MIGLDSDKRCGEGSGAKGEEWQAERRGFARTRRRDVSSSDAFAVVDDGP